MTDTAIGNLIEISENFFSLEGEAQFTSHPTVYVRFARCNLKCPLFNNHNRAVTQDGYAELGFNPKDYNSIKDMPIISRGCDSQYSVNPDFKHMWKVMTLDDIAEDVLSLIPNRSFTYPTGQKIIMSLTGGEPTLRWKEIPRLIKNPKLDDCKHVLIETNCTVPFKERFIEELADWLNGDDERVWTWSNSPKLSSSGHRRRKTIKPQVALMQQALKNSFAPGRVNLYMKFVVKDESDVKEVEEVMSMYHDAGLDKKTPVWLMPMACTFQQQDQVAQHVADLCMQNGYLFSYRLQNALWKNQVGT